MGLDVCTYKTDKWVIESGMISSAIDIARYIVQQNQFCVNLPIAK